MRRIADFLARPIAAAFLASFATALLLGSKPPEQHFTERVVERVEVPGSDKVVYVTRYVCDPGVSAKLNNDVRGGSATSGTGTAGNRGVGRVGLTGADPAHASGDNAAAVGQSAVATSGDAVNGQLTQIEASGCARVVANLDNTCIDCIAKTGDAESENRAEVAAGSGSLPFSSPSPSPSPEVVKDQEATDPPSVRTAPGPTTSPSPTPGALPSP